MGINYAGIRRRAHRMIKRYGMRGILRRDSGDRSCTILETSYSPRELRQMQNLPPFKFLVSAEDLVGTIDKELDKLVLLDPDTGVEIDVLKIIAPPGRLAPGGKVVYWEVQAR